MKTIEKIRAEIERLKGQLIRGACAAQISFETSCKDEAYDELLSFLSTLESEKPTPAEGLEEEIINYFGRMPDDEDKIVLARHFAQWGADHFRSVTKMVSGSSEIPNDLQKYASRAGFDYVDDIVLLAEPNYRWNDHDVEYAYRDGIIAGAKWDRQQMMKEAVEGDVTTDNRGNNVIRAGVFNKDFEYGDKVRVIIEKEDEK